MKKVWSLLAIAVAAVVLTACGSNGGDKDTGSKNDKKADTVTIWAWDETFNVKAANLAKDYYSNKDVAVEVVTMSQDDIVQKLNTSLASGNKEGLPNVVLIEDYRIQGYLTSYPDAFTDLSDIVDENNFAPYKFAVNKVDDKIYGVPFDSGVAGVFYRRDYFKEAGYEEKDLQDINWDTLLDTARDVKEKTGHPLLAMNPSDLGLTRIIMQSAGSWFTGDDGKTVTLSDNAALKKALDVQATLLKEGLVEQVSDWDGGVNAVQSGNVAGAIMGNWYSSTIQGAEDQSGEWGVAPIPVIADISESVHASSIGGGGWYVIKDVPGEEHAKEYLKETFASNVDFMEKVTAETGAVSTLLSVKDTKVYTEGSKFYGDQKVYQDFLSWSSEVPNVNYGENTYAIESILTESLQKIINGESVDKALEKAQKQAEDQLGN